MGKNINGKPANGAMNLGIGATKHAIAAIPPIPMQLGPHPDAVLIPMQLGPDPDAVLIPMQLGPDPDACNYCYY